jgi:hypothetical protein
MTREKLIAHTIENLSKLSDENLREVSDYAEFLLNKIEEKDLTKGILQLADKSTSFKFLEDEEDLYSIGDLKEVYR